MVSSVLVLLVKFPMVEIISVILVQKFLQCRTVIINTVGITVFIKYWVHRFIFHVDCLEVRVEMICRSSCCPYIRLVLECR